MSGRVSDVCRCSEWRIFGKGLFLIDSIVFKVRLGKVPLFPSYLCGSPNITDMFGGCPGEVNGMIDSVWGVRCLVHGEWGQWGRSRHHTPLITIKALEKLKVEFLFFTFIWFYLHLR